MAQDWFHNRAGWTIVNADACVTIIRSSLNIAALVLGQKNCTLPSVDTDFEVLDSNQYCPSMDGATYGTGSEARKFPWLNVGENHEDRLLTRGTEFRDDTMKLLMRTSAIRGNPVYGWIDSKGKLTKRFKTSLKGADTYLS